MSAYRKAEKPKRVRARLDTDVDDVGYGKPPRRHQFKPGVSGNPRGRKKGVKNESTILRKLLGHKVSLNERGRTRKITLMEAILRKVAEDCLRGNIKSIGFLMNRYSAASGEVSDDTLSPDDMAVLDAYVRNAKKNSDNDDEVD